MNCSDFIPILIDHLDGRLDPGRSAEAARHLETCAACTRETEMHRRTWDLAGRIDAIEPAPSFADAVRRRVRRGRFMAVVSSCAAAAVLAFGLVWALRGHSPSPGGGDVALRLAPEDRLLLEELARDRTWELAENIELIRALELLETAAPPEEDH